MESAAQRSDFGHVFMPGCSTNVRLHCSSPPSRDPYRRLHAPLILVILDLLDPAPCPSFASCTRSRHHAPAQIPPRRPSPSRQSLGLPLAATQRQLARRRTRLPHFRHLANGLCWRRGRVRPRPCRWTSASRSRRRTLAQQASCARWAQMPGSRSRNTFVTVGRASHRTASLERVAQDCRDSAGASNIGDLDDRLRSGCNRRRYSLRASGGVCSSFNSASHAKP